MRRPPLGGREATCTRITPPLGVGSGRIATPLGPQVGIDPSKAIPGSARARGIEVFEVGAEHLPFSDDSLDHALVVTTLCFVDSPEAMLAQSRRVPWPGGLLVMGFIDRDSARGRHQEGRRQASVCCRNATFHSASDVQCLLIDGGI